MSSVSTPGPTGMTVRYAVGPAVTRADIPCLCAALADLLRARPVPGQVVCDASTARPDVITVEALARLRLTAGRHGWRFSVHGAAPELVSLFGLMGLGGFIAAAQQAATQHAAAQQAAAQHAVAPPGAAARRSVVRAEAGRQAEEREQPLGVEEVVDPGDATV